MPIRATASPAERKKAVTGLNKLSGALWQALPDRKNNALASPWSVGIALGMTWAGARGETADEMAKALRYSLSQDDLHPAFGSLIQALSGCKAQQGYDLVVANSLWPHARFELRQRFVDLLKKNYGVGVRSLDFQADADKNARIINAWVAHYTQQMIKRLLSQSDLSPLTRLVLVNTIYFKGDWEHPFDKDLTKPAPFHLADGTTVQVPLMRQSHRFQVHEAPGFRSVRLPYKGKRIAMEVYLPNKRGSLTSVEKTLASRSFDPVVKAGTRATVNLWLPRFELRAKYRLRRPLRALGMKRAFDANRADFTGLSPQAKGGFCVGQVIHEAVCEVDETGTRAAAATAVGVVGAARPPKTVTFRVDRPFLFLLRDQRTSAVLFVGRVMDPR